MQTTVEVAVPMELLSWYQDEGKRDALRRKLQDLLSRGLGVRPEDVKIIFVVKSPWA